MVSKSTPYVESHQKCHRINAKRSTQHQIIKNLTNVLEAAGSNRDKIVKVNIFIADMKDLVP